MSGEPTTVLHGGDGADDGPGAAGGRRARGRRRAHRGRARRSRRRAARRRARHVGRRLRAAGIHGLARALPQLGAGPARARPARRALARRGGRAGRRGGPARRLDPRPRLARRAVAARRRAERGGAARRRAGRAARRTTAIRCGSNAPALALAGGDLETPGGVVERDGDGAPTGVLREEAAWRFEARIAPGREETLDAMRAALPAVSAAGVVALHDKDGGRGAPALFAALGELPFGVWQSIPADRLDAEPESADYVKAFMDGTLGSGTARMLAGGGVEITSSAALAAIIRARRGPAAPGRGPRDRRPRQPRGARRLRGDRGDLAPARAAPPDRARPVRPSRRRAALRPAWHHRLGPVHARPERPRCGRPAVG